VPAVSRRSGTPEETAALGEALGRTLGPGDVVALYGELGSGKTCLVQGLVRGLGVTSPATSPTFVLVNEYHRPDGQRLWHLDCYRLKSGGEALALGFDDLLGAGGVMVIEWPEHIAEVLPAERLRISMRWVDNSRRGLLVEAGGARSQALLDDFRRSAFGN